MAGVVNFDYCPLEDCGQMIAFYDNDYQTACRCGAVISREGRKLIVVSSPQIVEEQEKNKKEDPDW